MATHYITSSDTDKKICSFAEYDKNLIKEIIIKYLRENPTDQVEYYKVNNSKKYYGDTLLDFYAINPKNNKVSKIITKGSKEYFSSIEG